MFAEIRKLLMQVVQDHNGLYSSKRIITFIAFALLCIAFISNLYWGFSITQFIFDAMMYIVISGFGFATIGEKLPEILGSSKNKTSTTIEATTTTTTAPEVL